MAFYGGGGGRLDLFVREGVFFVRLVMICWVGYWGLIVLKFFVLPRFLAYYCLCCF